MRGGATAAGEEERTRNSVWRLVKLVRRLPVSLPPFPSVCGD